MSSAERCRRISNVDRKTGAPKTSQRQPVSCQRHPRMNRGPHHTCLEEARAPRNVGTMTAPVVVGSHDVSAVRAGHRRVHRASHLRWRAFSKQSGTSSSAGRIFLPPRTTRRRRKGRSAVAVADGGGSALDLLVSSGVLIAVGQAGAYTPARFVPRAPSSPSRVPAESCSFFLTAPPPPLPQACARSPP